VSRLLHRGAGGKDHGNVSGVVSAFPKTVLFIWGEGLRAKRTRRRAAAVAEHCGARARKAGIALTNAKLKLESAGIVL
jgi:hypothetical protein